MRFSRVMFAIFDADGEQLHDEVFHTRQAAWAYLNRHVSPALQSRYTIDEVTP